MMLTRERKVYAALAALGVGVLVVDRAMPGPSGARAAGEAVPARNPGAGASGGSPEPAAQAANKVVGVSLADRLMAAQPGALRFEEHDAFVLPATWAPAPPEEVEKPAEVAPAELVRQQYELKAIIILGESVRVRVRKKGETGPGAEFTMGLGDSVGGLELVSVGVRSAVFRAGNHEAELSLPSPMTSGGIRPAEGKDQ